MLFLPGQDSDVDWGDAQDEEVQSFLDIVENFAENYVGGAPHPLAAEIIGNQFLNDIETTDEVHTSYGGGH